MTIVAESIRKSRNILIEFIGHPEVRKHPLRSIWRLGNWGVREALRLNADGVSGSWLSWVQNVPLTIDDPA